MLVVVAQVCHQAAGGPGFLCGRCNQQRPASSGRSHDQSQQRETETDERTEHSQTGKLPRNLKETMTYS